MLVLWNKKFTILSFSLHYWIIEGASNHKCMMASYTWIEAINLDCWLIIFFIFIVHGIQHHMISIIIGICIPLCTSINFISSLCTPRHDHQWWSNCHTYLQHHENQLKHFYFFEYWQFYYSHHDCFPIQFVNNRNQFALIHRTNKK